MFRRCRCGFANRGIQCVSLFHGDHSDRFRLKLLRQLTTLNLWRNGLRNDHYGRLEAVDAFNLGPGQDFSRGRFSGDAGQACLDLNRLIGGKVCYGQPQLATRVLGGDGIDRCQGDVTVDINTGIEGEILVDERFLPG